jgi:hypothetical protein
MYFLRAFTMPCSGEVEARALELAMIIESAGQINRALDSSGRTIIARDQGKRSREK